MKRQYWEDFIPGQVDELGPITVSEAEIIAFARLYDAQPFHIDPVAAEASPFGGIIASGWHTASLCMRMMVDASRPGDAPMPSPGIEKLRWLKPVRPGDTLRQTRRVDRVNPSGSRPDRGLVWHNHDLFNQRGECVMSMTSMVIVSRRPMAEGA